MNFWDWTLALAFNIAIIIYGFHLSRGVKTSTDWFLAGRQLPWWLVGLSMYATAIDSSDLVADSGGTYTLGLAYFTSNWVGIVGGWVLAGFFIFLPMYRKGMYTNAEYLEARFSPGLRVLCALVQVQYRTLVLGIIATTLFLTLSIVCGWEAWLSWLAVVLIAIIAAVYTAFGGLRSVAQTDALQFGLMSVSSLVIWFLIWGQIGGWEGIEAHLAAFNPELPAQLLHGGVDKVELEDVSDYNPQQLTGRLLLGGNYDASRDVIAHYTPAWLFALALMIMGAAYSVVNHTQSMRMFAARSEWDLKMSVFAASVPMLVMSFFNLSMGVMGRALVPDQSTLPDGRQDSIYPFLVSQFDTVGIKGLMVGGILAASLSTYDSIGSSLSALLTRDVYARWLVRNRKDRHYLRVGQWLTPAIISVSFLYVPALLTGGMLLFYLELTSVFVIPLLATFLMGSCTRVHQKSGLPGLLAGVLYGILRLFAPWIAETYGVAVLPTFMAGTYSAYPWSLLISSGTMIILSLGLGWEPRERLRQQHREIGKWLQSSSQAVRELQADPSSHTFRSGPVIKFLPIVLALASLMTGCFLSFVVFW